MMISVQIENLDQIKNAFEKSPSRMAEELDKAIKLSIISTQKETLLNLSGSRGIQKISGGLYKSVVRGIKFEKLRGSLIPDINYAGFVHEGTYKMKARPFLKDALNTQDKQIQSYFVNAAENVMKAIGRDA